MSRAPLLSAGAGLCLIASPAIAGVSLIATSKPVAPGDESFVSMVVNVYALFDGTDTATNFLTVVGGLPGGLEGNVSVIGGEFYQNALGGRTAPNEGFLPLVPGLAVDSFVTIGAKIFGAATVVRVDATRLTPDFPTEDGVPQLGGSWTPTRLQLDDAAWYVTPDDEQGHVGLAFNGPDTVLIGQFSIAAGADPNAGIAGTLLVQGVNNGQPFLELLSFAIPGPGTLAVLSFAGLLGVRRRRQSAPSAR